MTAEKQALKDEFYEETGLRWLNGDEEPDINYVDYLEDRIIATNYLIQQLSDKCNIKLN